MIWQARPIKEQIRITEMYSLFETHYKCGYVFPGETHNFWECLYVQKGEVCVSADERVYNLTSGEIIFHKPLELHKFIVNSAAGADLLIFSFAAEGDLTGYLRDKVFRLSQAQIVMVNGLLSYIHARTQTVDGRMELHYYLAPFESSTCYSQMVAAYLCQLMLSLSEEGNVSSVSSSPDAIVFRKAISYLNHNLHRQPTVREIAKYCNVSEAGLKRVFDKYADIGVHKYLLKLKIKAATELLHDGQSVSEVADKLGFNSQSYFSKAFKRETGTSPSDLKRSH